jgi:hypothetical protein
MEKSSFDLVQDIRYVVLMAKSLQIPIELVLGIASSTDATIALWRRQADLPSRRETARRSIEAGATGADSGCPLELEDPARAASGE